MPEPVGKVIVMLKQLKTKFPQLLRARSYDFLTLAAIMIYGVVFSYFTVLKYAVFQSYAWDLGIFNQAFYTTLHDGRLFYYTPELFYNLSGSYFAMHISPILFLVLPFYAICPSPATLLIMKSFVLALGALPLYLLAKELLGSNKAGFMLAITYLLYAPLQGANWFDFQQHMFLPFLFFSMCYFMVKRRWKLYFLTVPLTLMVEEHLPIILFVFSACFLFMGDIKSTFRSIKARKMDVGLATIITMIACVIYFFAAIIIKDSFPINQALLQLYKAVGNFNVLGVKEDPFLVPIYALSNPQHAFQALLYDYSYKLFYVVLLFGPLAFISFRNRLALGATLLLAPLLLSNYRAYYSVGTHYPLYVLAFVFIAAIYALKQLPLQSKFFSLKTIMVATLLFTISTSPLSPMSNAFIKTGLLWYPSVDFSMNENIRSLQELIDVVPPNASILTQNHLFPHVSNRINAYVIPFSYFEGNEEYIKSLMNRSEYVLLDMSSMDNMTKIVMTEITTNSSFGVYALGSDAILFKRDYDAEPMFAHYIDRAYSVYKDLTLASPPAEVVVDASSQSGSVVFCPKGSSGYFVLGPYGYLLQGSYEVRFLLRFGGHGDGYVGTLDVSDDYGRTVLCKRDVYGFESQTNEWFNLTLTFNSTRLRTSVEYRAFSSGNNDIYIDKVYVRRISTNVTTDFGLKTFNARDLSLHSGSLDENGFFVNDLNASADFFWYGPYSSLPAGEYRATFFMKISKLSEGQSEKILSLSISSDSGRNVLMESDLYSKNFTEQDISEWHGFQLEFTAVNNLQNVEFRGIYPSPAYKILFAYVMIERLN
ncbi:DUF2079 domain-containing protein [Candidatus Bathyarchaeota archaeon]|nr:DUF2079 domain-containing protein [Candidatus Bathyarchaeota archaeon]